ncbi:Ung1 [Kluyveromyces lactis]|nr:Ung1 [Kluyveromyces lactis]
MSAIKRGSEATAQLATKRTKVLVTDFFKKTDTTQKNASNQSVTESNSKSVFVNKVLDTIDLPEEDTDKNKLKNAILQFVPEEKKCLLDLELDTIDISWLRRLKQEFSKPYFLKLKEFVVNEQKNCTVFPPPKDIYSWTRLTHFDDVRVVIIGQDPYHNFNQAHGLAFSVRSPTPAPPSLKNIYKELQLNNYSDFKVNYSYGDLSSWSKQGVLLLNTSLTVKAHSANSHSKRGWEQFTKRAIDLLIEDRMKNGKPIVFLLWGNNAIKLIEGEKRHLPSNFKVLKSVHPSPLSASRGFFGNKHFKIINDYLFENKEPMIDWSVVPGSTLQEVSEANKKLE